MSRSIKEVPADFVLPIEDLTYYEKLYQAYPEQFSLKNCLENFESSLIKSVLVPELKALGVEYLYCTDGNYFKTLTKQTKAEPHLGYVLPCAIQGYEHMHVVLSMNYKTVFA